MEVIIATQIVTCILVSPTIIRFVIIYICNDFCNDLVTNFTWVNIATFNLPNHREHTVINDNALNITVFGSGYSLNLTDNTNYGTLAWINTIGFDFRAFNPFPTPVGTVVPTTLGQATTKAIGLTQETRFGYSGIVGTGNVNTGEIGYLLIKY